MKLSEIFNYLNYGELAEISLGGANEAGILEENYPAIVSHLNMGLIELYKRFPLRKNSVKVQMYDSISVYKLITEFSATNGSALIKYILDSAEDPFTGKVLQIDSVTSDNKEINLILNDTSVTQDVIQTLSHNSFEIINFTPDQILTVNYKESPELISVTNLDPSAVEIDLPDSLLEPLVYYIAARAHTNVPSIEGNPSESTLYYQKFELSVRKVKEYGLIDNHYNSNTRLDDNGWV